MVSTYGNVYGDSLRLLYPPIIYAESDVAFTAFMRTLVKRESAGKYDSARAIINMLKMKYCYNYYPKMPYSIPSNLKENCLVRCLVANMTDTEAFQISVEESRTQVKVSAKNLQNEMMTRISYLDYEKSKLASTINGLQQSKKILQRKKAKKQK